jgi:aldose 1-epimerase
MTDFGHLPDGRAVRRITIAAGELTVSVLTLGAILQDVRLAGVGHGLTLGSDRLADYLSGMHWWGSLVGPVANRIGGARAVVDGVERQFPANQDGRHALHSGPVSLCHKLWDVVEESGAHVVLAVDLPDGEGGFPGNRRVTARFAVAAPAALTLEITTTSDAATLVNITNHSYWNLDGSDRWPGHNLRIAADHYLPVDDDLIPTGEVRAVAGTDMDLRGGVVLVPGAPAIDHNFCLAPGRRGMTDVLWLTGAAGVQMVLSTTEPGVQIYDGRAAARPGRGVYEGLAIEAQGWPDAMHHPHFPPVALGVGDSVTQAMGWRFTR